MAEDPIRREDEEWRGTLSPGQYAVCRCSATEPPFDSASKFDSGTCSRTARRRPGCATASIPPRWSSKPTTRTDQPRNAPTCATALAASAARS
jgi:hypothetical protein